LARQRHRTRLPPLQLILSRVIGKKSAIHRSQLLAQRFSFAQHRHLRRKEIEMKKVAVLLATAGIVFTTPAFGGEITGNGKPIDIHARTECAYSGYNDQDGDPRDPGWISQNYGQNVRLTPLDPSTLDPTNAAGAFFVPIPGFACNPNRYHDLHADG
jgi:hypothetical protein